MKTQAIEKQITKKEKELNTLKAKLEEAKNKVNFIVIDGWAYETKEHNFNKTIKEINIPEGKELWLPSECYKFYENKKLRKDLNLNDCWFFVKQIRDNTDDVARFCTNSNYANLGCFRDSDCSGSYLGVRFKWKVKNGK